MVYEPFTGPHDMSPPVQPYQYSAVSTSSLPMSSTAVGHSEYQHGRPGPQTSHSGGSRASGMGPSMMVPMNGSSTSLNEMGGGRRQSHSSSQPTTIQSKMNETRNLWVTNSAAGEPVSPGATSSEGDRRTSPSARAAKAAEAYYATHPRPAAGSSSQQSPPIPTSELTEEQALFVNNLHSLNVPAAEIARLMEIMRRERDTSAAAGEGTSNTPYGGDAPPQYDFKGPPPS